MEQGASLEMAQNPFFDHFCQQKGSGDYFLITFVNNSKDILAMFTIGKHIDWLRRASSNWVIVRELHKDGRVHFHAIARIKYKDLKVSWFKYKYRGHIKFLTNGRSMSGTFKSLSTPQGLSKFKNGIAKSVVDSAKARTRTNKDHGGQPGFVTPVTGYLSKSIPFGRCARYEGWSCSCKVDHINNYFSKLFPCSDILSYIGVNAVHLQGNRKDSEVGKVDGCGRKGSSQNKERSRAGQKDSSSVKAC